MPDFFQTLKIRIEAPDLATAQQTAAEIEESVHEETLANAIMGIGFLIEHSLETSDPLQGER